MENKFTLDGSRSDGGRLWWRRIRRRRGGGGGQYFCSLLLAVVALPALALDLHMPPENSVEAQVWRTIAITVGWCICIAVVFWGHAQYRAGFDSFMGGGFAVFYVKPPALAAYLPHLLALGVLGIAGFNSLRFFGAGRPERKPLPVLCLASGVVLAILLDAWNVLSFLKPQPH